MMRIIKVRFWYWLRFFAPEGLLGLYEKVKWHRRILPIPLPEEGSAFRVLVTPARHAGQGKQWSDALNRLQGVSSRSITVQNEGYGHDADYVVSWVYATLSRKWQKSLRRALVEHYTHILVEASIPPLGGSFGGNFRKQVKWLQQQGIKVGFIAHGSEIRLPSRHAALEKCSPFAAPESEKLTTLLETVAKENAILYKEFNVPAFVSTAGLKVDLPNAAFLGLAIDSKKYATDVKPFTNETIVVCHISSHSVLKATTKLRPILKELEAEGLLIFREYSGITQDQVPAILAESDIVLDQFALGDYGVFACEGLASGRLVLSHISQPVRAEILRCTGNELPIPETTLDNIEWRLRHIVANQAHYQEIARRGPEFISRVHTGGYSAEVLWENFLSQS